MSQAEILRFQTFGFVQCKQLLSPKETQIISDAFDAAMERAEGHKPKADQTAGVVNLVHNAILVMCLFCWVYTFVVPRWSLEGSSARDHFRIIFWCPSQADGFPDQGTVRAARKLELGMSRPANSP